MFRATLDTLYGTLTVGGRSPEVSRAIDARPEEMLMTFELSDLSSRGVKRDVKSPTEVTFVSKTELKTRR
jgi:hypothetical protein